jgi:2-alkyl-3-oxoalkanoate reductase
MKPRRRQGRQDEDVRSGGLQPPNSLSVLGALRFTKIDLMHALVTGGSGFLGSYIVEQLVARGDRVRAYCRGTAQELRRLGVEIVQGDLRERDRTIAACKGADAVFHVGGVSGIWGPWRHYYETNTLGTQFIVEGCRWHGVGRLVYTSSPSVTFDGRDQCGVDESAPYAKRWLCHYPHSKALAEQVVLAANNTSGLLTCALRPHLVWGPRDRHLIPRLLARQQAGQLRRVGDGRNLIDVTYVDNAAAAHLQAADALKPGSPVCGRAYFISQGEPVNCWKWIDQILAIARQPPLQRSIPLSLAWTAGAVLEAVHKICRRLDEPRMTRFLAAQLGHSHYFDITRAKTDFGFNPAISIAEGMRRLDEWLRPTILPKHRGYLPRYLPPA